MSHSFSIYDYAEIVYQFLKMLNITKVTIAAHSSVAELQ